MSDIVRRLPTALGRAMAALTAWAWQAAAWAQTTPAGTVSVNIVKNKKGLELSPMTQALISFGIGLVAIAVSVFMINKILIKGFKINPLTSSKTSLMAGLLALYALFAVLFTPVFSGGAQIVMYVVVGVLALASVFTVVARN